MNHIIVIDEDTILSAVGLRKFKVIRAGAGEAESKFSWTEWEATYENRVVLKGCTHTETFALIERANNAMRA